MIVTTERCRTSIVILALLDILFPLAYSRERQGSSARHETTQDIRGMGAAEGGSHED
jgi:hypothetical protein